MSLTERESQALGSIAHGLAGSDPGLAAMLNIFSRLAASEEMPACEKIRIRRGRPAALRPRRARRHPGRALSQPHRLCPRLGWSRAMLLLWAGISAALVAVALVLSNSGPKACVRSMGTACLSPSIPQHAGASPLMSPPPAKAFPHRQPASCAIVPLDRQAHMIGNARPRANGGSFPATPTLNEVEARPCQPSPGAFRAQLITVAGSGTISF